MLRFPLKQKWELPGKLNLKILRKRIAKAVLFFLKIAAYKA